jgi:hypothetical protein
MHAPLQPIEARDRAMDKEVHDRMLSVAEVCRDEIEALALSVTRFVAAGYMTSDVACWDAAYDAADGVIGPTEGAQLIARLTVVMRAIRAERGADWRFMPAPCCRVTEDERRLIDLLQAGREARWSDVEARAAALAGAPAAPRLASAVRIVAEALGPCRGRGEEPAPGRRTASLH